MQMKAFVVRIWRDDECGVMRGQVTDPQTLQRVPFQDSAELWQIINKQLYTEQDQQDTLNAGSLVKQGDQTAELL